MRRRLVLHERDVTVQLLLGELNLESPLVAARHYLYPMKVPLPWGFELNTLQGRPPPPSLSLLRDGGGPPSQS